MNTKEKNLQISFFSIDQTMFCFNLQGIVAKRILLFKNIYTPLRVNFQGEKKREKKLEECTQTQKKSEKPGVKVYNFNIIVRFSGVPVHPRLFLPHLAGYIGMK